MKINMFLRYVCIVVLFVLSLPAIVRAQFNYVTNSDGVSITITGYTGAGGAVVIPNTINGYTVTSIGDYAFNQVFSLTDITIPDSVTNIGTGAFESTSLETIVIPSSVTSIGNYAFSYTPLTSAYFDGNAPHLKGAAFYGSPATVYYVLGTTGWGSTFGGAPTVGITPPSEFEYITNNGSITITGYTGTSGAVAIPNTINGYLVTSIGVEAFYNLVILTNVTIANGMTSIGQSAFSYCISLANIVIPGSITSIGQQAFSFSALTNVTVLGNVTNLDSFAFEDCNKLTSIYFAGNAPPDNETVFNVDPVTVYYLPGTTGWGPTFDGAPTLGETPPFDFTYKTNKASITITFYVGPSSGVAIPSTINGYPVTSIGTNAFYSLLLTSVTIPNGVTNIGPGAFDDCTNLASAMIPASVTSMGLAAFEQCTSLTNVTIANGAPYIAVAEFWGCTNLTSITIPNSVTNIGEYAFEDCGLTTVIIPASVTGIGDYAFSDPGYLTSVYFQGNAVSLDSTLFDGKNNFYVYVYYLPGTTGWSPYNSFNFRVALWYPQATAFTTAGGKFGFTITAAPGNNPITVVVQACTNLANPVWLPVSTNTINFSGGTSPFSDPQGMNSQTRYYRFAAP